MTTEPIPPADIAKLRYETDSADVIRLLDEVDRLTAENELFRKGACLDVSEIRVLAQTAEMNASRVRELTAELARTVDLRVRDAAYSAAREKEAMWLIESVMFAFGGSAEYKRRQAAWLVGKAEANKPSEAPR